MAETSGGAQYSNALKREDIVALNTSQFPASTAQFNDLLRAVLAQKLPNSDLGPLTLEADLAGTDISTLQVELTNCQIRPTKSEYQPQNKEEPLTAFETGRIAYLNVQAQPLIVGDAKVKFRIEGRDLAVGWFRLPEEELGVGILNEPAAGGSAPTGKLSAEADPQELAELVGAFAKMSLPDNVHVYRPRASVKQPGPEDFAMRASCRARYKIFRVRLGLEIIGSLTSTGLLTVERFSLRGSNWILRMFTRVFRREFEKTHDLNGSLTGGSKLTNLRFSAGDKLALSGELR